LNGNKRQLSKDVILYLGDNKEILSKCPDNYFDSIVTDCPYGLKFMGKAWDYDVPTMEQWQECLRVLKPGGHLVSFGGTRTYHRLVVNIEDAGFEIRDQIMWLHGQGFPKSHNVSKSIDKKLGKERNVVGVGKSKGMQGCSKRNFDQGARPYVKGIPNQESEYPITTPASPEAIQWDGWGTALKPANEPICLARKPISEKTIVDNVLKWGVGGIFIDGCRIELNGEIVPINKLENWSGFGGEIRPDYEQTQNTEGRFPANVIFDEEAGGMLDEQSGVSKSNIRPPSGGKILNPETGWNANSIVDKTIRGHADSGGASRFFYCAKVSKKERNLGLPEGLINDHPTAKPISLMQWLIRLVTPPNGIVLDPFMGSGSTGCAAVLENKPFRGIDLSPEYIEFSKARIEYYIENSIT